MARTTAKAAAKTVDAMEAAPAEAVVRPIYLESLNLVERLHRRLLDVIKDEFDRRGRADVNSVQALLLYNIGDEELTAGDLRTRGYYLGSNVSYNLKKLVEAGYLHHGDVNDDDRPYVMDFSGRRIVGIPLTMDVNDLPICIRYGQGPRHMLDTFQDTFAAFRERETVPLMLDVTAHTHVMGRPTAAWVYDEIMQRVLAADDVWICTREQMARYVLTQVKEARP